MNNNGAPSNAILEAGLAPNRVAEIGTASTFIQQLQHISPLKAMIPGCTHSEQYDKILPALIEALPKIDPAPKNQTNTFHHNKYADLSSVMETIKKPLGDSGLAVLQPVSAEGNVVKVNTVLIHTSGQWIASSLSMTASKNDPQGVGMSLTYARRYSLSGMLGIVADEDDDGNTASGINQQQNRQQGPRNQANAAPRAQTPKQTASAPAAQTQTEATQTTKPEVVDPEQAKKSYDRLKEIVGSPDVIKKYYDGCWEKRPASGSPEYLKALNDAVSTLEKASPEQVKAFVDNPTEAGKTWASSRQQNASA